MVMVRIDIQHRLDPRCRDCVLIIIVTPYSVELLSSLDTAHDFCNFITYMYSSKHKT